MLIIHVFCGYTVYIHALVCPQVLPIAIPQKCLTELMLGFVVYTAELVS